MSTEYTASRVSHEGATFWLEKGAEGKQLVIDGAAAAVLDAFSGTADGGRLTAPTNADNARALRNTLPWFKPRPWGLATSAGTGDRLGLGTPGQVRAFQEVTGVNPVFAQQSWNRTASIRASVRIGAARHGRIVSASL